jgi:hypothetical protein
MWWFEGVYLRVGSIPATKIVVVERTHVASGYDLEDVFGPAEDALRQVKREEFGLLVDCRRAPGRNDAEFERAFEPHRQRLQRGFRRVAVVVSTAHGRLQVERYSREDRRPSAGFDSFDAAVSWLEEMLTKPGL